jgi:hypothetical protein
MLRRCAVVLSCVASSLAVGSSPASAAQGTVQLHVSPTFAQTVGEGYVAGAVCSATAVPATGEAVLATSVRCRVNAIQSEWRTLPGPRSATSVLNATAAPILICVDGVGTFAPTNALPYLVTVTTCVVMPT